MYIVSSNFSAFRASYLCLCNCFLFLFYKFDCLSYRLCLFFFFFQAEDGIRDLTVTGVQTCALPISVDQEGVTEVHRASRTGSQGLRPLCCHPKLLSQLQK